jgi:hypothetical protein
VKLQCDDFKKGLACCLREAASSNNWVNLTARMSAAQSRQIRVAQQVTSDVVLQNNDKSQDHN